MSASHTAPGKEAPYYFVPGLSAHPVRGSIALLLFGLGMVMLVNGVAAGKWVTLAGVLAFLVVLYFWFGDAIQESEGGLYGRRIDISYRWSMGWFIFSEVMFFAAFFGALFYARLVATPELGDLDHRLYLWPDFTAVWPHTGPAGIIEPFASVGPFWLPTINTALLLTSGVTLTIAHHALLANHRSRTIFWMFLTVVLGAIFLGVQAYEYMHAYRDLNLKLSSGIFGSTFYMLTGFHGFHVLVGGLMLTVVLVRLIRGHFTPTHHFGFEGAAWYWHFVDVVWLGLYLLVYWT
ncbi:cytochrome c oxidase subunit 3 [Verticiella sediminum]|uniref:cytochrome-c oxidase n=1 Tax=Verticiella sediminum TaxID=1247510 RepID=A0A556AKA9_9BURK|nr:cytochrome c oxidase subunit 3 [Verticiella sediminum]TSH93334.1 cytochrome c oxidase subunit 3 [Verticiella sediminum]